MKGWIVDILTLLALLFTAFACVLLLSFLNVVQAQQQPVVQAQQQPVVQTKPAFWSLAFCFQPQLYDYDCRLLSRPVDYKICIAMRDAMNQHPVAGRAFCRPALNENQF